jgi:hypothetical protein
MTPKIIKKLLALGGIESEENRREQLYRDLLRHEAKIGGTLFGPLPSNVHREFFCLDQHTWVWYEKWVDETGEQHTRTTKYSVRPNGIVKAHDGQHYQRVTDQEALRLLDAARSYQARVNSEIYATPARC